MIKFKHILYLVFPLLAIAVWYLPAVFYFWSFHPMEWSDTARLMVAAEGMFSCIASILFAYWAIEKIK